MISAKAAGIAPYKAGEQPRNRTYIKLNTNENPYPPGAGIISALNGADFSRLRLYPDPESTVLKEAAAREFNLSPENVFCGNGSDEILAFCFRAFYDENARNVHFPDITYSFYPVWCGLFDINYKTIPLHADFEIKAQDYLNLKENQGIILANPNAPTGRALPLTEIEKIVAANKNKAVIIDEAYIDFGAETAAPLVRKYDNICVVRTFSKGYSLAGLRAGFCLASEPLITALKKIRDCFNSYPLDYLAQTASAAALSDKAYHAETSQKLMKTRERFVQELKSAGFYVAPSQANFVFAKFGQGDGGVDRSGQGKRPPVRNAPVNTTVPLTAENLYLKLKEAGILVRWFDKPLIKDYLRITIGTDGEMDACISELRKITDN